MGAQRLQDLVMWQKAHAWVLLIYKLTAQFPRSELFGLTSQLRRAAVSVPANIVEGFKRRTRAEKARFYNIAQASHDEARYYLILAEDLGYAATAVHRSLADEVARLLDAYTRALTG